MKTAKKKAVKRRVPKKKKTAGRPQSSKASAPAPVPPRRRGVKPTISSQVERFLWLVAAGTQSNAAAYVEAFNVKMSTARSASSIVLAKIAVQYRLNEIRKEIAADCKLPVLARLDYLASAVLTPICEIDENSPLCQEAKTVITERTLKGGEKVTTTTKTVKAVDKLKALDTINRMLGDYAAEKFEISKGKTLAGEEAQARFEKAQAEQEEQNAKNEQ